MRIFCRSSGIDLPVLSKLFKVAWEMYKSGRGPNTPGVQSNPAQRSGVTSVSHNKLQTSCDVYEVRSLSHSFQAWIEARVRCLPQELQAVVLRVQMPFHYHSRSSSRCQDWN